MSYDLMVFNYLKAPCELRQLQQWFHTHMETDVLPENPPMKFHTFLECMGKHFPSIDHCSDDLLEYACEYEVHEDFIYMCFGYSAANEAHDIVKRQAKIDNLGFWDVSQSFDCTFPITLPADKWPMTLEAKWIEKGKCFVYNYEEIRKLLIQMKTIEKSSICLTDRHGNYIQAGGYKDTFIVEVRNYSNAVTYRHVRADLSGKALDEEVSVPINNWEIRVPESQILSMSQVCVLFQEFVDESKSEEMNIFWRELEI